ncbi:unnamed protein product [Effrenium voratum]|nr:unnamed protein product [Effrenium voratum]
MAQKLLLFALLCGAEAAKRTRAEEDAALLELDSDHSGKVEFSELEAFGKSQGLTSDAIQQEFRRLDLNGDGVIEAEELRRGLRGGSSGGQGSFDSPQAPPQPELAVRQTAPEASNGLLESEADLDASAQHSAGRAGFAQRERRVHRGPCGRPAPFGPGAPRCARTRRMPRKRLEGLPGRGGGGKLLPSRREWLLARERFRAAAFLWPKMAWARMAKRVVSRSEERKAQLFTALTIAFFFVVAYFNSRKEDDSEEKRIKEEVKRLVRLKKEFEESEEQEELDDDSLSASLKAAQEKMDEDEDGDGAKAEGEGEGKEGEEAEGKEDKGESKDDSKDDGEDKPPPKPSPPKPPKPSPPTPPKPSPPAPPSDKE